MTQELQHTKPSDEEVLSKVKILLEREALAFDKDEIEVLREMISVFETMQAFGRIGSWFKNIMVGIAAAIGAYYAIYNWGSAIAKGVLQTLVGVP